MLPLLLIFSLLVQLAEAATSESSAPDPTSSSYRSVWSILGTCALTLIICIWNVAYPNIMHEKKQYKVMLYRVALALSALVTPELTSVRAYSEWRNAGKITQDFGDKQWTRTHGFFALMGGFILQDGPQQELLNTREGLACLADDNIVNPKITKEQIGDRSKSNALGNAILVLQLSWFILQVIARAVNHVAITLVEIDTLALAALSLPLFFFWWSKPMAAAYPHIFYKKISSSVDGEKQNSSFEPDQAFSVSRSKTDWFSEIVIGGGDDDENVVFVGLIVWMVFGALHLIAWDFQFPTQTEKTIWRAASLTLIGAPCIFFLAFFLDKIRAVRPSDILMNTIAGATLCIGVIARLLLLVLMLASLRDLPPSAHDTVSWTVFVPHL